MSKPLISVIAAYTKPDSAYGVGESDLPWPLFGGLPGDLQRLYRHTTDTPEGGVNVLVAGKKTFHSMNSVKLGDKRKLVGVSTSIDPGNGYGHNRAFVHSPDDALRFAQEINAYRVIFLGGEALWLYGLKIADEAYLTVAMRACTDEHAIRLKIPLHTIAEDRGMHLIKTEVYIAPEEGCAWANYEAQTWKRKP